MPNLFKLTLICTATQAKIDFLFSLFNVHGLDLQGVRGLDVLSELFLAGGEVTAKLAATLLPGVRGDCGGRSGGRVSG